MPSTVVSVVALGGRWVMARFATREAGLWMPPASAASTAATEDYLPQRERLRTRQ
jgi:hypothetical protein